MKTFLSILTAVFFLGTTTSFAQDAADNTKKTPQLQHVDSDGRVVKAQATAQTQKAVKTTEVKTVKAVAADTDDVKTKTVSKSEAVSKSGKKSCSSYSKKSCSGSKKAAKACSGSKANAKTASVEPTMSAPQTTQNDGRADDVE